MTMTLEVDETAAEMVEMLTTRRSHASHLHRRSQNGSETAHAVN